MALTPSFPAPTGRATSSLESARALAGSVVRDTAGAARAGVLPRSAAPVVTARADMAVDVAAFEAIVTRNGVPAFIANDGAVRVPVGTAPTSNRRIDLVYVKQNQSASPFSDGSNDPVFGYVSSDVAATPSLAQAIGRLPAGALQLGAVSIPSGATATQSSSPGVVIEQVYPYTATAGEVWVRNAAERDAWTPADECVVYQLDVKRTYRRSEGSWVEPAPPVFTAGLRRSDGSLIVNSGSTALRWQIINSQPSGYVAGSDGNGAFLTFPEPGLYRISAHAPIDINANYWASLGINASGSTVIEDLPGEESGTPGFSRLTASMFVWVPSTAAKVWFPLSANAAGTMRSDVRVAVFRVRDLAD